MHIAITTSLNLTEKSNRLSALFTGEVLLWVSFDASSNVSLAIALIVVFSAMRLARLLSCFENLVVTLHVRHWSNVLEFRVARSRCAFQQTCSCSSCPEQGSFFGRLKLLALGLAFLNFCVIFSQHLVSPFRHTSKSWKWKTPESDLQLNGWTKYASCPNFGGHDTKNGNALNLIWKLFHFYFNKKRNMNARQ